MCAASARRQSRRFRTKASIRSRFSLTALQNLRFCGRLFGQGRNFFEIPAKTTAHVAGFRTEIGGLRHSDTSLGLLMVCGCAMCAALLYQPAVILPTIDYEIDIDRLGFDLIKN